MTEYSPGMWQVPLFLVFDGGIVQDLLWDFVSYLIQALHKYVDVDSWQDSS